MLTLRKTTANSSKLRLQSESIKNNGIVSRLSFMAFIPTDVSAKTLNSLSLQDILSVGTNKGFQNIPIGMKAKIGVGRLTIRSPPMHR